MAHTSAPVRKRADLPAVSMRDASTGTRRSGARRLLWRRHRSPPRRPVAADPAAPAARATFCAGRCSSWSPPGTALLAGLVTRPRLRVGVGVTGAAGIYGRSVVFGGALFPGACLLPIAVKWLLVGRWRPTEFPLWGLAYVRFWTVKVLLHANPMVLFVGSPLYVLYLRLLGADRPRRDDPVARGARLHRPADDRRRHRDPARMPISSATGRTRAGSRPARSPSAGTPSWARTASWRSARRWATAPNWATPPPCTTAPRCPPASGGTARPPSPRTPTTSACPRRTAPRCAGSRSHWPVCSRRSSCSCRSRSVAPTCC